MSLGPLNKALKGLLSGLALKALFHALEGLIKVLQFFIMAFKGQTRGKLEGSLGKRGMPSTLQMLSLVSLHL
jgi:hypothetical protein